jgi:hypothetical protein
VAADAPRLIEGDEYVDLVKPAAGVQQVQATRRTAPGHAHPRSVVSEATWAKIVGPLRPEGRAPSRPRQLHATRDVADTPRAPFRSGILDAFRTSASAVRRVGTHGERPPRGTSVVPRGQGVDDVGARMALTVDNAVRGEADTLADGIGASRPEGADVLLNAAFTGLCAFA